MTHRVWQVECLVFIPLAPIAILDGSEPYGNDQTPFSERHLAAFDNKHCKEMGDGDPRFWTNSFCVPKTCGSYVDNHVDEGPIALSTAVPRTLPIR